MGTSKTEINLRRLLAAAPNQQNQAKLQHYVATLREQLEELGEEKTPEGLPRVSKAQLNDYSEKIEALASKLVVSEPAVEESEEPASVTTVGESSFKAREESPPLGSPRLRRRPVIQSQAEDRSRSVLQHDRSATVKLDAASRTHIDKHRSMDEIYHALAERLVPTAAAASNPNFKYIVGLAGPPGAGKSTVASEVVKRVNKLWPGKSSAFDSQVDPPDVAIVLPMDGFHLYRRQLDAMEDPKEAHARRGAPWTFNPELMLKCLKTLRNQGSVYAPSFDHGAGDPVEDDIFVNLQHKVVLVEGNYLLLDEGVWKEISAVFDEKWFIKIDIETSMKRVLKRHISTGKPPDVAKWRIDYNDRPNAELINESKKNADLVIRSIDL